MSGKGSLRVVYTGFIKLYLFRGISGNYKFFSCTNQLYELKFYTSVKGYTV